MSKLRTNQIETLDGLNTKDVATLVDDINAAEITTSTGTQTLAGSLDDRLVYVNTIAERDTLSVAVGQQVSVGGIVYENTGVGTWDNLSGFTTPEVHGAVGDGSADDTSAVSSADSEGVKLECSPGASYRLTAAITIASPQFVSNGASFVLDFSLASPSAAITVSGATVADKIEISIPTLRVIDRALLVSGVGAKVDTVDISSVDQQNNRNANTDAAIGVTASSVSIRSVAISNFDNGVHWSGDDGSLLKLDMSSYVRGVWLDTPSRFSFGTWRIATTSPNASGSPGHNGVLATGVTDLSGQEINVTDSGEHGVRFSGNANDANRITIERIICRNTGNSGVKFRCDDAFTINDVNIGSIHCEDCGDATNPITNQEGLMLERVRRVWIGHYSIRKRNKTFSCHNGISVFDAQIVDIGSVKIEDTNREAIYLESESNDDAGLPIFKDINDFRIGGGRVNTPGRHGIYLNLDTAVVRNIHVDGPLHMKNIGSANAALLVGQLNGSQVVADSFFIFHWVRVTPTSGDPVRGSGLNANVLLEVSGNNSPLTTISKIGSTWWNTATGDRFIRDGAGNWVNII